MSIKAKILDEIMRVAVQQRKTLGTLNDNIPLANSGLDSLCIAILVASLHDSLGIDPFDRDGTVPLPMTIGAFAALYENAAT